MSNALTIYKSTYFCGEIDALEDRVRKLGGSLICESLRVDGDVTHAA